MADLLLALRYLRPRRRWLAAGVGLGALGAVISAHAAETTRRSYEVAAGDAAGALRELSAISGREILFAAESVRGVRTNAVRGEFTPLEAVRQLLAGTRLSVVQDEKTGALAVRREKTASPTLPAPAPDPSEKRP